MPEIITARVTIKEETLKPREFHTSYIIHTNSKQNETIESITHRELRLSDDVEVTNVIVEGVFKIR